MIEDSSDESVFKDLIFPNVEKYKFKIQDIYYIGMKSPASNKRWSLSLGTPTCTVQKLYAQRNRGTTHDRFLLLPDYYNQAHGSDFCNFLDHMEAVSERIGKLLFDQGVNLNN